MIESWDALCARLSSTPGLKPVGLRRVAIGADALAALPAIVSELRAGRAGDVVLLRDDTPKWTDGDEVHDLVKRLLADGVSEFVLSGPAGHVYADEGTTGIAVAGASRAGVIVTVGSGTLADLGKMAAAGTGAPHVIVQTAASVNGFADNQSVLLRSGVKRTVTSCWPDALVVDAGILAGAPPVLTRAGVGDLLSMFTAPADWLLATEAGFPSGYQQSVVDLVRPHGERLLSLVPALAAGEPEALAVLAELLTLSGVGMGVTGSTAPSSGMEHLISHLLDMRASAGGHPAAPHGAQVGVGCLVAAETWERVRAALSGPTAAPIRLPDPDSALRRVEDAFLPLDPSGRIARECWNAYAAKLRALEPVLPRLRRLVADWGAVDDRFGGLLLGRDRLADALGTLGGPTSFDELRPEYTVDVANWAVVNAHLMRDRFTIADLADLLSVQ